MKNDYQNDFLVYEMNSDSKSKKVQMRITHLLDDYISYYIDNRNKKVMMILKTIDNRRPEKYNKNDLINFYTNSTKLPYITNEIILTERNRYIILDKINNLLFIPLYSKMGNIKSYAYSELCNLNLLSRYTFCLMKTTQGRIYVNSSEGTMHEIIFGRKAKKGHKLDHINSNGLDNRSSNVRELTDSENSGNRKLKEEGFVGVSFVSADKLWMSSIMHQKKTYGLGRYKDPIEAARIRDIYAIHLYRGIKPINQIDGVNILSDEEIQDVLENGIPEKYIILDKKVRKLPPNIYESGAVNMRFETSLTRYFNTYERTESYLNKLKEKFSKELPKLKNVNVEKNLTNYSFTHRFSKSYKTLELALDGLQRLQKYIEKLDKIEKNFLTNDINNHRDYRGIAVIKAYDGKIDNYVDIRIDDDDWKEFIHFNWNISDKRYPVNFNLGDLHVTIFKKHFKEAYENRKDDETIDHRNRNRNDVRKKNLRLANRSQQAQNKNHVKKSCLKYIGVRIQAGKFEVQCTTKGKRQSGGRFEYLEDAARKYNELVLANDPEALINNVSDTKTTIEDLFHKDNIDLDFIDNLETIFELKEIFRANSDWAKDVHINGINCENFEETKQHLYELKCDDLYSI